MGMLSLLNDLLRHYPFSLQNLPRAHTRRTLADHLAGAFKSCAKSKWELLVLAWGYVLGCVREGEGVMIMVMPHHDQH